MNLRQLQYLSTLSDTCHFGQAATACFVSQPTLSMQIKKLEEELGVQLIERTQKSVMMTDIGQQIAERAKEILNQVNQMKSLAQSVTNPLSGTIKIGIIPTLSPYLLPIIMPKLRKALPNLNFYLLEEQTDVIVDKLHKGEIDTIIAATPIYNDYFEVRPLFKEPFLLAVPNNHKLAKRNKIKQSDIIGSQLLLLEQGHCLRDQALEVCHMLNRPLREDFRATSLETIKHMVSNGLGITLLPKLACMKKDTTINTIEFSKPAPFREIALFNRKASARGDLFDALANVISEHVSVN